MKKKKFLQPKGRGINKDMVYLSTVKGRDIYFGFNKEQWKNDKHLLRKVVTKARKY